MGGIPFLQTGKINRCQVTGESFLLLANLKCILSEFLDVVSQLLQRVMGVNLALPCANIHFTLIDLLIAVNTFTQAVGVQD